MSKRKIILIFISFLFSTVLFSQSLINSRPRSKRMHVPKTDLTSNWYIGMKTGINHMIKDRGNINPFIYGYAPAFNILVGKDLSPFVSLRIESTGLYLYALDLNDESFKIDLIGGNCDALININNIFRLVSNFNIYGSLGIGYNYTSADAEWFVKNNLLSHRVGTLFSYTTNGPFDIVAEFVLNLVPDNFNRITRGGSEYDFYGQYTIGFKYYFNRDDF